MLKLPLKISDKFRAALKKYNAPQFKLARQVGFHPNSLSQYLTGMLIPKADDERFFKLAELVGITRSDMFE